ncbi:MAG: type II secretion system F family protein [Lachnospiraceae bacterium]|nr:type II secretion system F family protein [Lachnospiraceae bacterium]
MNVWFSVSAFFLLFAGIYGIMRQMKEGDEVRKAAHRILVRVDEKGRQSAAQKRNALKMRSRDESLMGRLNRALIYSGIRRRHPRIYAETFLALICLASASLLIGAGAVAGIAAGLICMTAFVASVYACIRFMEISALKRTGEDMPRLLDLLGSFAVSGAVYSNIFGQISTYMNEPLRSAFEECEAEGKMSGDLSLALLSLADKIEHPQFKQLIRNMEITSRHSEDIEGLVNDTRRSLRDYIRESSDRKTMLRESAINMGLLILMSMVVLVITASLSETSVTGILTATIPGRVTLFVIAAVLFLYFSQAAALYK